MEKKYIVKKDRILHEGNDVTATFSLEEQAKIKDEFSNLVEGIKLKQKEVKDSKKSEKELNQKEKAQSNYEKAIKNYSQAQSKYEKLKEKGKLSPKDEAKWLKKQESLNEKLEKAEKKMKRSQFRLFSTLVINSPIFEGSSQRVITTRFFSLSITIKLPPKPAA